MRSFLVGTAGFEPSEAVTNWSAVARDPVGCVEMRVALGWCVAAGERE
jgi:hypothetical protein